jgi:hypothetical protein
MAKAKSPKAGKSGRGGGPLVLVGIGLGAGILMSYALPTGLLLGLGLLPSLLAYAFDPVPGRPGARAVFFFNLSGLAPALAELWRAGQGVSGSLALLADWHTLGLAWGGAALGFLLKAGLPLAAGLSVDAQVRARRAVLDRRRAELMEEWGAPE